MRFRHSTVSFAVAIALAACATSGADNLHGPSFENEAGPGQEGGADAAADTTPETSPGTDGGGDVETARRSRRERRHGDGSPTAPLRDDQRHRRDGDGSPLRVVDGHPRRERVVPRRSRVRAWTVVDGQRRLGRSLGGADADPVRQRLPRVLRRYGRRERLPLSGPPTRVRGTAPATIGAALAQGNPGARRHRATGHVVYWGSDSKFYHGTYSGSAWDAASDPVEASGGAQSFGPSAPAATATGTTLLAAQSVRTAWSIDQAWTGSWQAANALAGSSVVSSLSPAITAMNGGTRS